MGVKIPLFLKWAGGKKQLIEQFEEHFPDKLEHYFEPFVGGGAVFLHLSKTREPATNYIQKQKKIYI